MADIETADKGLLIQIYTAYKQEAETARLSRIQQNKVNYDAYHLRQDWSFKQKGQSTEFLPKVYMAVEQAANFLQAGLVDMGEWFRVYPTPGLTEANMKIKPNEIQQILQRQLEKSGFLGQMGDAIKLGFLGSLMIAKIHGKYVPKVTYKVVNEMEGGTYKPKLIKQTDKKWQLVVEMIRQQDWKPDPTAKDGLFNMQDVYMDWHDLDILAKNSKSKSSAYKYDMEAVEALRLTGIGQSTLQEYEKSRETGQNIHNVNYRHRIKLTEMWGNFVSPDGKLVWENCVAIIANDLSVVMKPQPIKSWHGGDPYVSTPILRVPHSVWGKTPIDAGAQLNLAMNEMYNLMLDGGLAAVHGIKQVREHWLEDPSQIEDGIPAGETLRVNTSCPPGAVALERVDTTTLPPEALPMFNLINQEFVTAVMSSDLRMGVQNQRQVKATEIVESSQANTSMLTAIAKHIEADFIKPILMKAWLTIAQNMNDFDDKELGSLIGDDRAAAIKHMGNEGLFAETAEQIKFEVFGISETLNKQKEFTKLQAMLQTIASAPVLMEEFTKKYDFGKLLTELLRSMDVPMYKIQADEILHSNTGQGQPSTAPGQGQPGQQQPGAVPDAQSQIPQAGSNNSQTGESPFPQPKLPNFPGSASLQSGKG